jgi:hypothetical protein
MLLSAEFGFPPDKSSTANQANPERNHSLRRVRSLESERLWLQICVQTVTTLKLNKAQDRQRTMGF